MTDAAILEQIVLGGILAGGEGAPGFVAVLLPDDFTTEKHRLTYNALAEIAERREPLTPHNVVAVLGANGHIGKVGPSALIELAENWAPTNTEPYVAQLKAATARRKLTQASHKIAQRAENGDDPAEIIAQAQRDLSAALNSTAPTRAMTAAEYIAKAGGLERYFQPRPGLATPWRALNAITGGLEYGSANVLAARPSCGKTAMALQIACHAAAKGAVAFFSLEMHPDAIIRRAIASMARVSYQQLRLGQMTPEQRTRVSRASAAFAELPIYFDGSGQTVTGIRAQLRHIQAKRNLVLVVVDYLQLMTASTNGKRENRNVEVGEISRGLKLAAVEFNVPFLVLSQLNRTPARDCRRPVLSDLKDSGAIEQDADVALLIHRDQEAISRSHVELIVAKQRNGPLADIDLRFDPEYGLFTEAAAHDVAA